MVSRFIVLALFLALSCGGASEPGYEPVAPASIGLTEAIPSPSQEIVLTISGRVAAKNTSDALNLDIATLEKLGLVKYTVHDPWLKQTITYSGVLMSDQLEYAGTFHAARSVHMVALDDYQVDIPIADINKWPILLATRANGEYLSVDNYGPTRIIHPYGSHSINGWESIAVASGEEVLEHLSKRRFDLIFVDLVMAWRDGAETTWEIRRLDPQARVVVVTAYLDSVLMSEALQAVYPGRTS